VKNATKYTANDWQIMESSFAELQEYFAFTEYVGIPDGCEHEFTKIVNASFAIMVEIIANLKGE